MSNVKFTINKKWVKDLEKKLDFSLEWAVQFIVNKIQEITPRDLKRPPLDPSRHVTWTLKRSIGYQRIWSLKYKTWSKQWSKNTRTWKDANVYWEKLEFWTKYIKERSFIRKWIEDNIDGIKRVFIKLTNKYLK